jgi:hypothetical protein
VFYLIVDRERTTDNVYLLNPVTEDDLMSLAKPGSGSESAIPAAVIPPAVTATPEPTPEPAPTAEKSGGSGGTIAFVVIAVIAVGGAGYYFKIVRPKQRGAFEDDDGYDDEGGEPYEDGEIDFENDDEEIVE